MFSILSQVSYEVNFHLNDWGNISIGDSFDPFSWSVADVRFAAGSVDDGEGRWKWGILLLAVRGLWNCLYRRRLFYEADFGVMIPPVGLIGEGELFNVSQSLSAKRMRRGTRDSMFG